jgi:hypothetical protein
MIPREQAWHERNQADLRAGLGRVKEALAQYASGRSLREDGVPNAGPGREPGTPQGSDLTALPQLAALLALTPFERDVLLLCAGVELDPTWTAAVAAADRDSGRTSPTFALALAALPGAHWSALSPGRPLRYWHLVEIEAGPTITGSPLRIDETILHYLAGTPTPDPRLEAYLASVALSDPLPESQARQAAEVAAFWRASDCQAPIPVVHLSGRTPEELRGVGAGVCVRLGMRLLALRARDLPAAPPEREWLARLSQREALLHGAALFIDGEGGTPEAVVGFVESLTAPVLVAGESWLRFERRPSIRVIVDPQRVEEKEAVWRAALGLTSGALSEELRTLARQFDLSPPEARAAARQAAAASAWSGRSLGACLWQAARWASRRELDALAERIEPRAGWEDLVLPRAQLDALHDIVAHVRHRETVQEEWGFADKSTRGMGVGALFAGPSGTGKTMAAEVLAKELGLDLYRIDLSQVVSKYIGETEKNLKRLFDAAERGRSVLLFDEADALFGRRSEVRDSHDRYANIEVSFLLQQVEAFRGLAILTSNMKNALDPAFLRRLRFVVQFPFPDAAQRAEIWRRVLPCRLPVGPLDHGRLSRLSVSGGSIRNIALAAAFVSAERGEPLSMSHILRAARGEYAKLDKSLSDAEVAGWH